MKYTLECVVYSPIICEIMNMGNLIYFLSGIITIYSS